MMRHRPQESNVFRATQTKRLIVRWDGSKRRRRCRTNVDIEKVLVECIIIMIIIIVSICFVAAHDSTHCRVRH